MNELTTTNTSSKALAMHAALQQYASAQKFNLTRFLSFNALRGEFLTKDAEKAEIVVKVGTKFYLNLPYIAHGHVCWKDGSAVEKIMHLMADMPVLPAIATLPDHGPYPGERDGWTEQLSLPLYHEDEKMGYIFQVSSLSALSATKRLIQKIVQEAVSKGHDLTSEIPQIEIYKDSYKNKITKKDMPIPGFRITGWRKAEEINLTVSALPQKEDDMHETVDNAGIKL